jgi:peptide/nickel transport system permease protein
MWSVASSTLISFPPFVSALFLVYFLAVSLKDFPVHFPASGWGYLGGGLGQNLSYAFLPALALALVEIPGLSRVLRADMVSTLQEDYVLAARARGVPTRRILLRHALRPSSFSLVTMASLSFARLMGGVIVVEVLFSVPGIGQLLIVSIFNKDVPVVQGLVMFIAVVYVLINAAVEVGYHALDPRVRAAGAAA